MNSPCTPQKLRELIHGGDAGRLNLALEDAHPHDLAEAAEHLNDEELWSLLQQLQPPLNADLFSHLPVDRQVQLAVSLDPPQSADLLEAMPADDRVDLVQQLDAETRQEVLAEMQSPQRQDVERLAGHAEDTAGAVMTSDVTTLKAEMTTAEAIEYLRQMAEERETIYYNYVVDEHGRLTGIVSLRDLVLARREVRLGEVMNPDVITVRVDEDQEAVASKFREYDLLALPVVDEAYHLLGVVTVDDIMDVAEEEATEDIHKLGGSTGLVPTSLREASFGLLYRKRIPWLMVLVFVNIFSGAGIAYYEDTIAAVVALVFFLPLLIDSGGNAGSQAATLMVRALATGEVVMKDWLKLLGREVTVALALGLTMAVGVAIVASFRVDPPDTMPVVMVVSLTMVLVVIAGSLIGMLLPFLFTKVNLDPATASGPLVTSLADITGVLLYFSIATWFLREQIAAAAGAG